MKKLARKMKKRIWHELELRMDEGYEKTELTEEMQSEPLRGD